MSRPSSHLSLPGESFVSQAEFDAYRARTQDDLDARYAYEHGLSAAERACRPGTCGACLAPTTFHTESTPPDWRDGQICGCPDRLGQRARAMLHLLQSDAGLDPWSRIMFLGPRSPLDRRLAPDRTQARTAPVRHARLITAPARENSPQTHRLNAPDRAFSHVMAWDYLQRVPPLETLLHETHRVLCPGGVFAFTLPFHYRAATTLSRLAHLPRHHGLLPAEFGADIHDIGWDILENLRRAGFARARAHHAWSDELGYLGAFNLLFTAEA